MTEYPLDPDGIFSKIIRGEIPASVVLDTDSALAFLDINPLAPGHTLLIPKGAFATLMDLPEELAAACGRLLPRLCRAVRDATSAEGINVVVNNGRVAGQSVEHVHWHIIPRRSGDPIRWPWPQTSYGPGELDQVLIRIRAKLSA